MKKTLLIIISVVIVLIAAAFSILWTLDRTGIPDDLSDVTSGVMGTVLLGPMCPVMREGDDSCADKPYQTIVRIAEIRNDNAFLYTEVESDAQGRFQIIVPSGRYLVDAKGGELFPRCAQEGVTVEADIMHEVNILCDTGIR